MSCASGAMTDKEVELLEYQIEEQRLTNEKLAIELIVAQDQERDRMVKVGRIRHLYVNDVISGQMSDKWLDALQHWERRDPGEPITIDINSPGGNITDGLALYDQLQRMRRKGHHITTRALGAAFSMGAVLLQAGDVRIADARAKILLHEGSGGMSGQMTVAEQEDARGFRELLLSDILDILCERSTLSKRQLSTRWKRKDWYMTADEALKLGFVDLVE
jgi:ATP-dependent Clp protease protease subunit